MRFQPCTWPLPLWTLVFPSIVCKCVCVRVDRCVHLPHFCSGVCLWFLFLSWRKKMEEEVRYCSTKRARRGDQSGADAHTCDVSADLCPGLRWQLSISVTRWFILLSSPPIFTNPLPSTTLIFFFHLSFHNAKCLPAPSHSSVMKALRKVGLELAHSHFFWNQWGARRGDGATVG